MLKQMRIIYVGTDGFPIGMAQMERQKLISKGLIAAGCGVLVLSRVGVYEQGKYDQVYSTGSFEGVPFLFAAGTPYRDPSKLKRLWLFGKGLVNEFLIIRQQKKLYGVSALMVSCLSFNEVVFYKIIALLLGIPMVLDNVEYFSSMQLKESRLKRIDFKFYDRYAFRLADKVVGISDFLVNIVRQGDKQKPVLKIPAIVDFSKFTSEARPTEDFFLYCGQAGYYAVISFIIGAYEKTAHGNFGLYLVSNGNAADMKMVKDRIMASAKASQIKLFSALPVQQLVDLYMTSKALLIPLRNTQQDIARFPHKIGEYCAAGKPIISTRIGEVGKYFKDGEDALLAETYNEEEFAAKLQVVVDEPEKASAIGRKSFELGKQNFDHISLGKKLKEFIKYG
jgi:glycosyltransferase involved in cell wall biosynthesis